MVAGGPEFKVLASVRQGTGLVRVRVRWALAKPG